VGATDDSVRGTLRALRPGGGTRGHADLEPDLGVGPPGELILDTPAGQEMRRRQPPAHGEAGAGRKHQAKDERSVDHDGEEG
jgi:hypothetical protein